MRILVLKSEDPILDFLITAWMRRGVEISAVNGFSVTVDELARLLDQAKPDFVFVNNFDCLLRAEGRALEDLLQGKGIPLVTWHWESPELAGGVAQIFRLRRSALPKNLVVFVSDSGFVDFFKSRSCPTFYLPMAADESLLSWKMKGPAVPRQAEYLFFSGACFEPRVAPPTPFSDQAYRQMQVDQVIHDFETVISLKLNTEVTTALTPQIHALFEKTTYALPHYREERQAFYENTKDLFVNDLAREAWAVFMGRLDIIASFYQLTLGLRYVSGQLPLVVHGSPTWGHLIEGLRERPCRLELTELYSHFQSALAVVACTKQVFRSFIHERVFWVYALGGLPLTDARDDLHSAFESDEILTYQDFREIPDLWRFLRENPSERRQFIERGRDRVRRQHLYAHRADEIVSVMKTIL